MPRKSPHPHVAWRDGRPRFSPGPELRAAGHTGRDLRHPDGRWFSKGEAVDWSERFQAELEAARSAERSTDRRRPSGATAGASRDSGDSARPKRPAPHQGYTVALMVADWQRSPKWLAGKGRAYAQNTRRDYLQKLRIVEDDHPLIWNAPAAIVRRPTIRAMYEEIWTARGLASARGAVLALSAAFGWAVLSGRVRRADNPCLGLRMEVPAPRVRFFSRKEFDAWVAAADALGRPEIGDMAYLGVWTGQRQADRLALADHARLNRRRIFRQAKTGAIVAVMEAPELEARLKAAEARRAAVRAAALLAAPPAERAALERTFALVVLDERRWQPFDKYHYTHLCAAVRAEAVKICPSLADIHEADLRDTAVTWMALAGATVPEIVAITGHSTESATRILRHYLARHPEMADSAIGKMISWYEGNGETEIGL